MLLFGGGSQVKCLKFKVPKVPKVIGTKMTITCFGPVFIGLKWDFLYYQVRSLVLLNRIKPHIAMVGEI